MMNYSDIVFSIDHLKHPFSIREKETRIPSAQEDKVQIIALSIFVGLVTLGVGGVFYFYALTAIYKFTKINMKFYKERGFLYEEINKMSLLQKGEKELMDEHVNKSAKEIQNYVLFFKKLVEDGASLQKVDGEVSLVKKKCLLEKKRNLGIEMLREILQDLSTYPSLNEVSYHRMRNEELKSFLTDRIVHHDQVKHKLIEFLEFHNSNIQERWEHAIEIRNRMDKFRPSS